MCMRVWILCVCAMARTSDKLISLGKHTDSY
uniref:Uncharacterized protein n=1 Tax=Arundo donax TaxID=35708 RepID=A0A0A9CR94_ARUDO